ncbi:hypothetical protein SAMN04488043_11627 [Thalassovita gelatinovora]|uniref:hypothetical protein n=1 Tax=Thalassovita gelatinovora TaxID=53501 RepID=UPI0008D5B33C|nr:hypothetical protein [Thalassovita gelatinovora]QIZ82673.1 hypothetical protein HFZ77_19065 [Thalassovita gelatinovora]SER11416.1 hypothetical protein SAMN04488043_11627 [Thalassovita gelatinovora]
MTDHSVTPGTLIILGRPDQAGLDRFGALPGRVVVVDPQADTVLPDQPGVERIAAWVSPSDGTAEMSLYSVAGLRSLTPPSPALTALFPRLRVQDRQPVQLISVDSLLARLGPLSKPLHVWIDMAGQDVALLQGVQAAGVLDMAEGLMIRCGVESFFEGAADCATLQSWLEPAAFDLTGLDETDPDWPDMSFRRNAMAQQLGQLESRIAAQQDELNAAQKTLAARDQEKAALAKEGADLRARVSTLETDLKTAQQDAETSRQALAARERDKALLVEQRADLQERVSTLETDLKTALDSLKGTQQELAARERDKALLVEQRADLRGQVSKLEGSLKAADAKAEAAHSDLGFQMRLKEMQKLDLDNLRQRFEDSERRRRQQEELFLKLTPRLSQASEQLRQLQLAADTPYSLADQEPQAKPKTAPVKRARGKAPSKRAKKV